MQHLLQNYTLHFHNVKTVDFDFMNSIKWEEISIDFFISSEKSRGKIISKYYFQVSKTNRFSPRNILGPTKENIFKRQKNDTMLQLDLLCFMAPYC